MPFPAGGPTDGMARIISERLGAVLGQSIVIENRGGGAGGSIGAKFVASRRSRRLHHPDDAGRIADHRARPCTPTSATIRSRCSRRSACSSRRRRSYPFIRTVPVKTLPELVAYAKANPGKLTWGSQGFGTAPHLLAELFKLEAGVNIVHVPYRGTAPMLAAILAGEVQMVADAEHHQSCRTSRPASCARWRSPGASASRNCRTCRPRPRSAIRSCSLRSGSAWWRRPARRPPSSTSSTPRSAKAWRRRRRARGSPTLGAEIKIGTPAEFGKMLADELAQWTAVAKAANIKVD